MRGRPLSVLGLRLAAGPGVPHVMGSAATVLRLVASGLFMGIVATPVASAQEAA